MAGSLALIVSEPIDEHQRPVSTIQPQSQSQFQWKVSFSRFIPHPSSSSSSSSTCPSLVPLPGNRRYRNSRGTWLSSHSPTSSLHLHNYLSSSPLPILTVSFRGNIIEEHYVSKLHFTWPQVSCLSGYPPRGSRAVLVSYRDSLGEIQKFALRFEVLSETETFINALKDILKDATDHETGSLNGDIIPSEISLQSMFLSANRNPNSKYEEEESSEMTMTMPVGDTCSSQQPQLLPFSLNYDQGELDSHTTEETSLNTSYEGVSSSAATSAALPPSFTSFLASCYSEVQPAAARPSSSDDSDLKSQIARYMEDSSFQDMLIKVEKVISEMGDDLLML